MVVKICDPVYYDDVYERAGLDVVWPAFGDYSREAAANNKLQTSLAAKDITPTFYRIWFTEIATLIGSFGQQHIHTRIVHLILIEPIQGECMLHVNPYDMRRRTRSRILEQMLDAEIIIFHAGVRHRDFHPLNVFLWYSNYDAPDLRVKIVEFNIAAVIGIEDSGERLNQLEQLWPCSPIVRFFCTMVDFSRYGWCSSEDTEAEKWLWRHYKDDSRYFPVVWNPKHTQRRPKYQVESDSEISKN